MRRTGLASESGYGLLAVISVSAALLVAGAAAIRITRFELRSTGQQIGQSQAFYVAEAGVQRALAQLAHDRAYASTFTTYRYPSSGTRTESWGGGSYEFWIEQDPAFASDPTRKRVVSTGTRSNQSAGVVSHAVVQPLSSSIPPSPTITPGFPPTDTPGPTPTPTPTPNEGSPYARVCDGDVLLASTNGTARLVNTAATASQLFGGNIFSNRDVEFQIDAAIANNASGTVRAGRDFNNAGLALGVLSNLSGASLYYEGSYDPAPLDGLVHLLWPLAAVGVHFGNGGSSHHGQDVGPGGIPEARQWRPDWKRLRRDATVVVSSESQPYGSWDAASGTWIVGTQGFAAGSTDRYYVEGNVRMTGINLTRTASPTIAARGWISVRSITVLATGLLGSDVQNVNLIAKGDLGIGRDVLDLNGGTFESLPSAISGGLGIGLDLVTVASRMNLFAYSEEGDAFAMVGTAAALARFRTCVLARGDATLARTASALTTVGPID